MGAYNSDENVKKPKGNVKPLGEVSDNNGIFLDFDTHTQGSFVHRFL